MGVYQQNHAVVIYCAVSWKPMMPVGAFSESTGNARPDLVFIVVSGFLSEMCFNLFLSHQTLL